MVIIICKIVSFHLMAKCWTLVRWETTYT